MPDPHFHRPSNNRDICARKSICSSPISNASSGLVVYAYVDPPARETSSCSPPPLRIYESWRSFGRRRRHSPRGQRERSPEPITGFMSDLSRKLPSTSTTVRSATKSTKSAQCSQFEPTRYLKQLCGPVTARPKNTRPSFRNPSRRQEPQKQSPHIGSECDCWRGR